PIWVLGSTMNGAAIAGQLGLPFSLASHFAPDQIDIAIKTYRDSFTADAPTAQIDEPYVMAGINVMVADTDAEAARQFTSVQQMFNDLRTGRRRNLQPSRWSPAPPCPRKRGAVRSCRSARSAHRTRRQRRWPSSFSAPEPTSSSPSPTPSIPRCSDSPCGCSPTRGSEEVSDRRRDRGEG